jgi:hypothetical protein
MLLDWFWRRSQLYWGARFSGAPLPATYSTVISNSAGILQYRRKLKAGAAGGGRNG